MEHTGTVPPATGSAATRGLLAAGVAAGPVYVVVGPVEALTREGFDLSRHSLSLPANGDLGWFTWPCWSRPGC